MSIDYHFVILSCSTKICARRGNDFLNGQWTTKTQCHVERVETSHKNKVVSSK